MEQISNTTVRFGNVAVPGTLRRSNTFGDWKKHINVPFGVSFGAPIPGKPKNVAQRISVILTPRTAVATTAVVEKVDATGFSFALRNADPNREVDDISVDWLAVLGVPDGKPQPFDARLSVLQYKHFSGFLDRNPRWPRIWFSTPMTPAVRGTVPVVLITANNLHVPGEDNPAVVGVVRDLEDSSQLLADNIIDGVSVYGMAVYATDLDSVGGNTGFYAAAFLPGGDPNERQPGSVKSWWLDHGSETNVDRYFLDTALAGVPYPVSPGGQSGDWKTVDIYFDRPFLTPPIVLATARGSTPVVCVARNVTTHGFTIASRNTDSVSGHALFYWVAIGCVEGCG
jgi:hypothetical protein